MKKSIIRALSVSALSVSSLLAMTACGKVQGAVYEKGTPVKVGLICLHDKESTYDANFINALDEAVKELGVEKVEYKEAWLKTGIEEDQNCYDAAKELVKEGCNVIFADSFGHQDYMLQAARDWPTVTFCHATGTNAKTANLDNYHNAFASIYEGRFLAGLAAGARLALDTAYLDGILNPADVPATKVGYVGAYPYAEVKSGYTSWFIGVRTAFSTIYQSEAVADKLSMDVQFTSSWYDPTAEAAAADSLIKAGAKLISQHADSMGAPGTCEKALIPNVTYNVETGTACPNTYLAYSRINWAPYYKEVINSLYEGRAIAGETNHNWTGTLSTGSVEYNINWDNVLKNVPTAEEKLIAKATLEAQFNETVAGLKAGTIKVFDTDNFALDATVAQKAGATIDANGHVTAYNADTDGDFAGDTQVIATYGSNGHFFDESKYCSAPYFDLDIKGINLPAAK